MPDSIIKADNVSSLSGEGVGFPNGSISNPSMKFTNSNTTGLYRPSANQLGLVTNGVERLRIDSNGQVSSVIPNGITLYNQFMCRAWVSFDGSTGPNINGSGNISSVARFFTGEFTITFLNPMPDTNYVIVATLNWSYTGSVVAVRVTTINTNNFILKVYDSTNVYNPTGIFVAVFR